MLSLGKWRCPVLVVLGCGVLALCVQFGVLELTFEAVTVLEGPKTIQLRGEGPTPAAAASAADAAGKTFIQNALTKKRDAILQKISNLDKRKASLTAGIGRLKTALRDASQGAARSRSAPLDAGKLREIKTRRDLLIQRFPNHPDIPLLAKQIQAAETAQKRGQTKSAGSVTDFGRRIAEAQIEVSLLNKKIQQHQKIDKSLQPLWRVVQPAQKPRWPVRSSGAPVAMATVLGVCALAYAGTRERKKNDSSPKISLELLSSGPPQKDLAPNAALPDDPLSRKAASIYQEWLKVVTRIYSPTTEPPLQVFDSADPLIKETAEFLPEGHDAMTRYLAFTITPGDLSSHVARTVVMALMGAYESGMSSEHQQGMTFAALFHDLAMVPRAAGTWDDIGAEVGRLSSDVVRKIPGLPPSLVAVVEAMLVAMDEHPMDVWQNVPRDKNVEPFAKLLRHIDRFDKVAQKQKSRLTRRLTPRAA